MKSRISRGNARKVMVLVLLAMMERVVECGWEVLISKVKNL